MENFAGTLDYHSLRRPDKVVLTEGDRTTTNAQLLERVQALAAGLADLRIAETDVVAILMQNRTEFIETIYAVNRIGAVFLPLNYRLSPAEWEYALDHSQAKAVVVDSAVAADVVAIAARMPWLEHILVVGDDVPEGARAYDALVGDHAGAEVPVADVPGDALQRLMYTSGTTSRPKGVMITHQNMMHKDLGMFIHLGWTDQDSALVSGPLYHVGALDMGGLAMLHVGGSLVIQRRFDAAQAIALIGEHRPTTVWWAPAMVNAVLQQEDVASADLGSIRMILSGGEKMPEARLAQLLGIFPGVWFSDAYGLTETVSGDTYMTREHMREKLGSVGRPVPHLSLRIADDLDQEVPVGVTGQVLLKGPKVFAGYWRNEAATRDAVRDGWFRTGDVGRVDEDGFLYIEDRKKDMIVSGGENIASPEVERVLYEHPDVIEAAVVGRAHEKWGEVPVAHVVLRPRAETDADGLIAFCRERLAKYKTPTEVHFRGELPRTPSGKILKRTLREQSDDHSGR